ncbi:BREX-2 system adenine-specific DNA-methyltransferase PglX [Solirubrobacter taibaiensis]|nr:BREX-2 system adenine-specific DNA-methyltransferase PglX [Solirubrobacter taibaiensis]
MINRTALLSALKPAVTALETSIAQRVDEVPDVAEHLAVEHEKAVAAERTATSLEEWRSGEITQAAVAWVLGCVFVRFLEDNRLIDQPLIAGAGARGAAALGHRSEYFQREPGHSDREYLEACFREVAAFPAVAALYDERHNPLWRLGPTADGASALRETFTSIDPDTGELSHDFTDPDLDTRFLGDLYQDLSEAAKKRYALLQTPDFVEAFILDRTLTPALAEFGLEEVRLIDPTCGSGHFLIGAFERLFALWQERDPGTATTVLAQRCLDQVAGVDLNPYATAIARFRLTILALHACGISRLAEAPAFTLHLATGDSLLHGPLPGEGATMLFDASRLDKNVAHFYESEDAGQLKEILGRGYHAVVGNPPYIAVQDGALRDAYRKRYDSCHGRYVLTVPFMERFFELARVNDRDDRRRAGFVGKITGNSFMKREFGAPLVERFLRSVDLNTVVDASGAYIPGHGTPTILLFGRSRPPVAQTMRVVDGIRGEPDQPADPARGLVWTSIRSLVDRPGEHDLFTRSTDVERRELLVHPMTLGVGRELGKRIVDGRGSVLADAAGDIGVFGMSNADDVFYLDAGTFRRKSASESAVPLVVGDSVRDWVTSGLDVSYFPYTDRLNAEPGDALHLLWPFRELLWARQTFARESYKREGRPWWAWHQVSLSRRHPPLTITWAFVATHNHFALDRVGNVFGRTAPVIKLHDGSSEEQHLALMGVLNSSIACFWIKQVAQNRGSTVDAVGARQRTVPWEDFYELSAKRVQEFPLPRHFSPNLPTLIDGVASQRTILLDDLSTTSGKSVAAVLEARQARDVALTDRLVSLQEELDWQVLAAYGLVPDDLPVFGEDAPPIKLGQRAFEVVLARQVARGETETTWFERHGSTPITNVPSHWPHEYRALVEQRIALIESDPDVGMIERPEHKRRWSRASWEGRVRDALTMLVLDALESPKIWEDLQPRSTAELTDHLRRTPLLVEALETIAGDRDADLGATLRRLVLDAAVPHPAAQRHTDAGLKKRAVWESVWDLQRAEDRGEIVERIPMPPKYAKPDFRSDAAWRHRGKLDVPKERFVLLPSAERGADTSPVVGWAGWDELQLARALAGRITELRDEDAADAKRVTPLLTGVLELLPWIHQWHPDADPDFAGPPGEFFESWLDGQLAELAVTRDTLRAWRPSAPVRGRRNVRRAA